MQAERVSLRQRFYSIGNDGVLPSGSATWEAWMPDTIFAVAAGGAIK